LGDFDGGVSVEGKGVVVYGARAKVSVRIIAAAEVAIGHFVSASVDGVVGIVA